MVGWGAVRGRYEWQVEEIPIRLSRLPKALDGFTIAQISDLHVGTFIGERELALGLEVVRRVRADLIVITGDIVDFDPGYIALAAGRLGALSAREGIVCIPGNHDYYTGAKGVMDGMARAGIDVLLNRGKVIARGDGGISILGVDDLSGARPSPDRGPGPDLPRALAMVPPDLASVLLAHQPRFVDRYARAGKGPRVDLQLSGHTHGGQINPGFSPAGLFLPYLAGRYDVGDTVLYVNRGFGTAGPPSRVGAPPEITKIVLVAG
jgi:predicted MPP superfamily phosphohydrolase